VKSFSIADIMDHDMGVCLKCGAEAYGVEPDARKYRCESCGALAVYGLEQALVMGRIAVCDEGESDE
jgi:hypothetical protein